MKVPFFKTLSRIVSRTHVGWELLLALNLIGVSHFTHAQAPVSNTPVKWPTLAEVLKKWGDVPLDEVEKGANSGDLTAQHYLGYCYTEGLRVTRDPRIGIRWYQRAFEAGYAPSGNNLGIIYKTGKIVPQNPERAMHYYRSAADAGYASAQFGVGTLYRDGIGVQPDPVEAMKWFRQAADRGNTVAMSEIGKMYYLGNGIPTNVTEAVRWTRLAAEKGDPLGQYNLGLMYTLGGEISPDNEMAFKLFQQAADRGRSDAMFELYRSYMQGRGIARDDDKATNWLAKAINAGGPNGREHFAALLNDIGGVQCYRQAADLGWTNAMFHLGRCYLSGEIVEQDENLGLEFIRKAADLGESDALTSLAYLYAEGIGEPRDEHDRPMELLQRSLKSNSWQEERYSSEIVYVRIQGVYHEVIFRFATGLGIERDPIAASQWYCRAASFDPRTYSLEDKIKEIPLDAWARSSQWRSPSDWGKESDEFLPVLYSYLKACRKDPNALMQLGNMYRMGQDVPKDAMRAWQWLSLASQNGSSEARAKIPELEKQMTSDELKEAKRLLPELVKELSSVAAILRETEGPVRQ